MTHSPLARGALALLAGVALAVAGLAPRLAAPPAALALDQTVTACDFATFASTLAAVQADGGGTIAFDCTGTIEFANELVITSDVTLVGNGGVTFDGNETTRFFTIEDGARLALTGLTLKDGKADYGGAIHNFGTLEITASTFTGNQADVNGGAIYSNSGTQEIAASTFTDNQADGNGGAIYSIIDAVTITASTFTGNQAASDGGAIYTNSGTLAITASTFMVNQAATSGGAVFASGGMTITASTFMDNQAGSSGGAVENVGTMAITASTFTDNQASIGGAIWNGSDMKITASTFTDNQADFGETIRNTGSVEISSSILVNSVNGVNCFGALSSLGSNLSDDDSCGFGPDAGAGDNLGDLTDNGGPTQTILPLTGSPALDAANCAETTDFDQRGAARPDTGCDIGAVEAGASVPVQIAIAYNLGPILVDQSVEIVVIAYGPAGASLTYEFDCDNNGDYEISQLDDPSAACTFTQAGSHVVAVRVSDGTTSATGQTTVEVLAALPNIVSLVLGPAPSNEAEPVSLTAEFTNLSSLATHSCEIDWGDGTVEPGSVVEIDGNGSCAGSHVYADDDAYTVSVTITDNDAESDSTSVVQTVANLPPMIDGITTNAPVPQGQPVNVTVNASDPGVNDVLNYAYDCNGDGIYEVDPQPVNTTDCPLDPAQASATINVLVEDGDGGSDTGSVTVSQTVTLCGNYYTGALSAPLPGGCPGGTTPLALPAPNPTTVCIDPYTRALSWSPMGSCSPSQRPHIVPGDGPLAYCRHTYTGDLRFSWNGQCGPHEQPGVIPG